MEQTSTLKFAFEWDRSQAVRTPELRATWARLEIWAGGECVTQVEDLESGSIRRSIYGSLYPLAEWIAYNWWFLLAHVRPASLRPASWTYSWLGRAPSYPHRWLDHHNVRAAAEGFAWPDMMLLPEGLLTHIVWRSDVVIARHRPVRFIRRGETWVESASVERVLAGLVDSVLTRLTEQGFGETTLHKEWEAVRHTGAEEEQFCLAAARLGLDPYSDGLPFADVLLEAAGSMEGRLFEDFLNAVNPRSIKAGINWVEQGSHSIENTPGPQRSARMSKLRSGVSPRLPVSPGRPWQLGWEQARQVRSILGLASDQSFDFDGLLALTQHPSGDRGLQALGGASSNDTAVLVLGRPMLEESSRFAQGRALWRFLHEPDEPRFLLTVAHTDRQKVERAFAAELLAPAEGVRQQLIDDEPVTQEDLEAVGKHFRTSPFVVGHQVENQLLVDMID